MLGSRPLTVSKKLDGSSKTEIWTVRIVKIFVFGVVVVFFDDFESAFIIRVDNCNDVSHRQFWKWMAPPKYFFDWSKFKNFGRKIENVLFITLRSKVSQGLPEINKKNYQIMSACNSRKIAEIFVEKIVQNKDINNTVNLT
jgi:hypothetical protein